MSQSRWATEFAGHPFQSSWLNIKEELALVEIDDQTVVTSVIELARLKRAVTYLDELIQGLDLDLTPLSVWGNFQPQSEACLKSIQAFASSKEISHVRQANVHIDNLLTYVRPFMVLPSKALGSLGKSARAYVSELEGYVESLRMKSGSLLDEITADHASVSEMKDQVETSSERVDALIKWLLEGTDDASSAKEQIEELVADIAAKNKSVNELHALLLVDQPEKPSLKTQITNAENEVFAKRKEIKDALDSVKGRVEDLEVFYERIYGTPVDESSEFSGGLERELDARLDQLDKFEIQQKERQRALFEKIERLLPGATSAGLARSYRVMKESFDIPIKRYTQYFYWSLGFIAGGTLLFAFETVSLWPPAIQLIKFSGWDQMLLGLVSRAGFYVPMVWLALFSATRRSQYERLQQEYAHKEALASSYESYKKQLESLQVNSDDLQRELIQKAVDAIAYNASTTLTGGHHEEKLPLVQLLERANLDPLMKLLDRLRGNEK